MSEVVFYNWPNGMRSVAGGTRSEDKVSRPGEKEMEANRETCPFCRDEGIFLKGFTGCEWRMMQNKFTPYIFHQLIIPRDCWSANEQRTLGGREKIAEALLYIHGVTVASGLENLFVAVHIGALAGQNVCHLHYHIVQYAFSDRSESIVPEKMREIFMEKKDLVLFDEGHSLVGAGGLRAGQCFILPKRQNQNVSTGEIANMINRIVSLYNEKFKSTEGLLPDFSIALQFHSGEFKYGIYSPVLSLWWGASELMAIYEPGYPLTLPWPHEQTVRYLTS